MLSNREAEQEVFLKKLLDVWKSFPELRFGQLIVNVVDMSDPYYIADEVLFRYLEAFKARQLNNHKLQEEVALYMEQPLKEEDV